jgi:hypothetical protein
MARGMGHNRHNTPLLVIVNSGPICAATSSFKSSPFLTVLTAGVAAYFSFSARDEFANVAEVAPIMAFWGIESSQGVIVPGRMFSMQSEFPSTSLDALQPPTVSGLMAHYTADSFDSARNVWNDLSGYGNHVTEISGTISVQRGYAPYIYGGTSSWMNFPSTVLPPAYTLIYVARYNGAAKGRIFNGLSSNWLSGFYAGSAGVAFHNCFITQQTDLHGSNWMVASDRRDSFRSNGVERRTGNSCVASNRLSINTQSSQRSDWAVQIVLVYNRKLADTEVSSVENWLMLNYSYISNENAFAAPSLLPTPSPVGVSFLPTISGYIRSRASIPISRLRASIPISRLTCSRVHAGQYRAVVRLANTSAGVSVAASDATYRVWSFSATTFFLSWNETAIFSLLPCESATRVIITGIWAPLVTGIVTFHLRGSWPAKMSVDRRVLIDADAVNSHRSATFLPNIDVFHEISIEFSCSTPAASSLVSLQ